MATKTKNVSQAPIAEFVSTRFRELADPAKAVEMAAYMKTEMPFYGVQKPQRIAIYKDLKKQFAPADQQTYLTNVAALWQMQHREEKYAALEYAFMFKSFITPDSMPLYEHLVRDGAWWDFVDVVAVHLIGNVLKNHRMKTKKTIDKWTDDDDMWIRRTTLICHNAHKIETDADHLFGTCKKLSHEKEFFIRKAIGWALRDYSYTDPNGVKKFLMQHRTVLSPLSFREGAKYLIRCGKIK